MPPRFLWKNAFVMTGLRSRVRMHGPRRADLSEDGHFRVHAPLGHGQSVLLLTMKCLLVCMFSLPNIYAFCMREKVLHDRAPWTVKSGSPAERAWVTFRGLPGTGKVLCSPFDPQQRGGVGAVEIPVTPRRTRGQERRGSVRAEPGSELTRGPQRRLGPEPRPEWLVQGLCQVRGFEPGLSVPGS